MLIFLLIKTLIINVAVRNFITPFMLIAAGTIFIMKMNQRSIHCYDYNK